MNAERKLLIVSNRLPLQLARDQEQWKVLSASGGLVSALSGVKPQLDFDWVGWPGTDIPKKEQAAIDALLKTSYRCYPVFLTTTEIERFYNGFSNSVLWPLFHYLPSLVDFSLKYWDEYQQVNAKFAETILPLCTANTMVWIHDYHLFLLPALLRAAYPQLKIGFFLHIPFPSSEIYRLLPVRKEILQGILGSDLIGFHSRDYLQHFSNTCLRILGLESTPNEVIQGERRIHLGAYPIGINPDDFLETLRSSAILEKRNALSDTYAGHKLILGVDRLDYTKGLDLKFKAYEAFLEKYPDLRQQVTLLQVVVPSRTKVHDYKKMKDELDHLVGRINGRFGTPHHIPISYMAQSISFDELCALYERADVLLITSIRDGMNLVSFEYTICKQGKGGALVLSEFTGAAHSLSHAILINPWDTHHVAEAIHTALLMTPGEQSERASHNFQYVKKFNSLMWARRFVKDMIHSVTEPPEKAVSLAPFYSQLEREFIHARRRTLFLDYDGTLAPFVPTPDSALPSERLLRLLIELCGNRKNVVYVVSGRTPTQMSEWFGHIPNLGLCAEHGFFLKAPQQKSWKQFSSASKEWMSIIKPILEDYVERTPGAYLEAKSQSLAWHYRQADEEFGDWQAHELMHHLEQSLANFPTEVIYSDKVVEIRPQGINKSLPLHHVLEQQSGPCFILCIGDDRTDEDMFAALPSHAWSCRIGTAKTRARFYLENGEQVTVLLAKLAQLSVIDDEKHATIRPLRSSVGM